MGNQNDKTKFIVRAGFGVNTGLMIFLIAIGLYLINISNQNLHNIVEVSNKKVEHASSMREAIRLRQIALNSMLTITDLEELDNKLTRFYNYATPYREARKKLLALPINYEEQELHEKLTRQVRISQPLNREAAEFFMRGTPLEATIPFVKRAQKEQNKLLSLLDELVLLQKDYAEKTVENGTKVYEQSILFSLIVGFLFIIATIAIAKQVSGYISRRNREQSNAYKQADEATCAKT